MPRKKVAEGIRVSLLRRSYGSGIRRKSERRRSRRTGETPESTEMQESEEKQGVELHYPLKDSTNHSESTPKRGTVSSESLDLGEMVWDGSPSVSPIKRELWSPDSSPEPPAVEKPQKENTYYVAPKIEFSKAYDMPIRPLVRKKIKKTNHQAELVAWMKKMNEDFAETEKHELAIVHDKR